MHLDPGTQLGRYQIQRRLGRGGMGTLYLALDPVLARSVALKLFHGDLDVADSRERFTREARAAAALNHPNIVTIHDFGEFSAQPFIVMEYIEGRTLADVIAARATVGLAEKLRWIEELCAGVAFVHRAGVIHRDIKPSNVMLDLTGRIKVLDFGIARMDSTLSPSATGPVGSPGYMAPEQITGEAVDHRADIFGIGVVCYELLTYARAFEGETVAQVHKILTVVPTPVSVLVPSIPRVLSDAIERAMAKDPCARFPDASSLAGVFTTARRECEPASTPTIIAVRPKIGGGPTPSAGSMRVGAESPDATPRPLTPWTDRDAFVRRRVEHIEAALREARALVDQDRLEEARDACEQALTIDETHRDGLVLYDSIRAALARREAVAVVAEARREFDRGALAAAADLLQRARGLDPQVAEAATLERDLRLARVDAGRARKRADLLQQLVRVAQDALDDRDLESALLHAREALDVDPVNERARAIETAALLQLDQETGASRGSSVVRHGEATSTQSLRPSGGEEVALRDETPTRPDTHGSKSGPAVTRAPHGLRQLVGGRSWMERARSLSPRIGGMGADAKRLSADMRARWHRLPRRQRQVLALCLAVAAIGLSSWVAWTPQRPLEVQQGTVLIDAVPWARVTAIVTEEGRSVDVPDASTPLSLELPVGLYRISLVGPPPGLEARQFEVRVESATVASVQQFLPLTPRDYFEQYLTARDPAETEVP